MNVLTRIIAVLRGSPEQPYALEMGVYDPAPPDLAGAAMRSPMTQLAERPANVVYIATWLQESRRCGVPRSVPRRRVP